MGGLLKKLPFIGTLRVMAMFAGSDCQASPTSRRMLVMFGAWKGLRVRRRGRLGR